MLIQQFCGLLWKTTNHITFQYQLYWKKLSKSYEKNHISRGGSSTEPEVRPSSRLFEAWRIHSYGRLKRQWDSVYCMCFCCCIGNDYESKVKFLQVTKCMQFGYCSSSSFVGFTEKSESDCFSVSIVLEQMSKVLFQ